MKTIVVLGAVLLCACGGTEIVQVVDAGPPPGICCEFYGEIVTQPMADGGITTDVGQDSLVVTGCPSVPATCSPASEAAPDALRCRWTQVSDLVASSKLVCFLPDSQ